MAKKVEGITLTPELNLTYSEEVQAKFVAIWQKSNDVDVVINNGRTTMTFELLAAMNNCQDNLNETAVDIAKNKLLWDGEPGSETPKQTEEQIALLNKIIQEGAALTRATFGLKSVQDSVYAAVKWPSDVKKTNDRTFCQTVSRAAMSAVAIFENPEEFHIIVQDNGKIQPRRAAYLQHDGGKNPGKMMREGQPVTAKDSPDMYEEVPGDVAGTVKIQPIFEDASWQNLQAEYRKKHPSAYSGSRKNRTEQEKAFEILSNDGLVSDCTKIAAVNTLVMKIENDPAAAALRSDIDDTAKALTAIRDKINKTLPKLLSAITDAADVLEAEENQEGIDEALETAKNI